MLCPTHIAGNRLDLVMTDFLDIVDGVVDDAKQTAYYAWCRTRNVEHWVNLYLLVLIGEQRVYGAAIKGVS